MKLSRNFPLFLIGPVVLLASCADLSNIKKFAAASADSASYTSFITDYEKSAERLRGYEPPEKAGELDQTIKDRTAQQKPLLGLLQGVQGYMNALGALASDQVIAYDTNLTAVGDGLIATKAVSSNEADAFVALTKLLARAVTDGYRQAKLKAVIREANPSFQTVVQALTNIVGKDFVASLDTESAGVDEHFKEVVESATHAPPQDASIELVRQLWQQKIDDIATKRQACLVYVKALDTVAKGHQALYDNVDKVTSSELLSTIDSYGTSVSQLLAQIKQLK